MYAETYRGVGQNAVLQKKRGVYLVLANFLSNSMLKTEKRAGGGGR